MKVIQRGSKTDRRHSFIKELFKQYKTLTRSQVIEITDVSPSTATKELQILCDEGFIVRRTPTTSPRTFYFELIENNKE
jgi:Fic family protein